MEGNLKKPPSKNERYQTGEEMNLGIVSNTSSLDLYFLFYLNRHVKL